MMRPEQLPPKGLKRSGKELWLAVNEALDLDAHEAAILLEACRTADRLDALDTAIRKRGPVLPDGRPLPALGEARQQQVVLARLIASLRLPEDLSEPRRPQRRYASRGIYKLYRREEAS